MRRILVTLALVLAAIVPAHAQSTFPPAGGSSSTPPALNTVTGAAAAGSITETAPGNAVTFAGVETGNATAPFVFSNLNSTNNNTSSPLILNAVGTSTGAVGLYINMAGGQVGNELQLGHSGSVSAAGVMTGFVADYSFSSGGFFTLPPGSVIQPNSSNLTIKATNGGGGTIFLNPGGSGNSLSISNATATTVPLMTVNAATSSTGNLASFQLNASPVAFISPAGQVNGTSFGTTTNCSSSASPAVCGSAAAGSVLIPTGTTSSTLQVNTTQVTANSQIVFYPDDSLGTRLSTTCNSTLATLVGGSFISARTPGTSFTITFNGTIAVNGVCGSYVIVN